MTKVDNSGKLEETYLSYKSRQIQQLAEQIQSESSSFSSFSQKRAYGNLQKLQNEMDEYGSANEDINLRGGQQVKDLINLNNDAIKQAEESYRKQNSESAQAPIDNRANFNRLILDQGARIGRNSINKAEQNFRSDYPANANAWGKNKRKEAAGEQAYGNEAFDGKWLERNQLQGIQIQDKQIDLQQQAGQAINQSKSAIVAAQDNVQVDDSISYINPIDRSRAQILQEPGNAAGMQGPNFGGSAGGGGGGGFGDLAGNDDLAGFLESNGSLAQSRQRQSGQLPSGDPAIALETESVLGSSLSSLDIELPERGTDFYFKSPRGKATVIVRPLETGSFSRWLSVAITLGVCLGVGLACWFLIWLSGKPVLRLIATIGLLLGGLISLAVAFFPVYGLIALVASIVLLFVWTINSFLQDPTAAVSRR